MNILGLSGGVKIGNQDGAAALLVDGELVAAAEEERLIGVKFANGRLPKHATAFCLKQAGITIRDLDFVVFAGATYENFEEILRRFFEFNFGVAPPIRLVDHHAAHAASAYVGSGWDRALIVTMDFSGDRKCTTIRMGENGKMRLLEEIFKPNSLGIYYSALTQYLGFDRDSDEYKVMGMAAYGEPRIDFTNILEVTSSGYRFHHDFILGLQPDTPSPSKQERLFDTFPLPFPPRLPGSPIEQVHYDVAASGQHQLERAVLALVEHYTSKHDVHHVCVAGGVALNCLLNQKICRSPSVEALYAPPICSDAGLSLGAAYLVALESGVRPAPLTHAYWGPEFSNAEIESDLERAGATYLTTSDPAKWAADRVANGKIVGWFQGRMEIGPRALGDRSILASPQNAAMKDEINGRVKFREEFRPLGPAVLDRAGDAYFNQYRTSPFMTQTFTASERTFRSAPAVVHADGTSRLQSVDSRTNPLFATLIECFENRTGLPLVVNTSLNAFNDPIACRPYQALRTYFATGMDALVIGPFVLEKKV